MLAALSDAINLDPGALAIVAFRTLVVYVVLLVLLRLFGKRELGQLTTFDLVVVLVVSNAVQNAMVGPDTSLTGGLVAATTLLVANRLVGLIDLLLDLRWPWLHRHLVGEPSLLVLRGRFIDDHLRREGVTRDEVMQAMREHGVENIDDIQMAVLEVDGTISVVPSDAKTTRTRRRVRGRASRA